MTIAWTTDPHFNFVPNPDLLDYISRVEELKPEVLFLTGDLAESHNVWKYLDILDSYLRIPIYYVLGNHDYYGSSIKEVRQEAKVRTKDPMTGHMWLPEAGVVRLSDTTAVVGVDGWADGKYGNPVHSKVVLNDWFAIKELVPTAVDHQFRRLPLLEHLGLCEANFLESNLRQALEEYQTVYVLTHIPPWDRAAWHEGFMSDADWLPWFTCKAVGDRIVEIAEEFPEKEVKVLCGHTHGQGFSQISNNVRVWTGGASYYALYVQEAP